ncbi:MAG: HAD family phosphatase [Chloroflexi bacterium]|nr:HAD family phosphatase [Chloroflexota bacterium]
MAPEDRPEAVIWDMDGVIVDSAPYHFRAWRQVFREKGVDFTEEDFKRHFGKRNDTIIRCTLGELPPGEVDAIAGEKESAYRGFIRGNTRPLPGAVELIKALHDAGLRMAVASSAPPENIDLIMGSLGITGWFRAVVWGREVAEGKPSPQCFLLAASKLGVPVASCVVIEDAIAGVAAARSAGMKCVAVTTTHPAAALKEADLVVETLESVSIDTLRGLFKGD